MTSLSNYGSFRRAAVTQSALECILWHSLAYNKNTCEIKFKQCNQSFVYNTACGHI